MVRRRVLELVPLELVLACIVVVPLVEVGCILAFVACRLVVLVVEASWVGVACKLASLVVVACILVGLACKMALVRWSWLVLWWLWSWLVFLWWWWRPLLYLWWWRWSLGWRWSVDWTLWWWWSWTIFWLGWPVFWSLWNNNRCWVNRQW